MVKYKTILLTFCSGIYSQTTMFPKLVFWFCRCIHIFKKLYQLLFTKAHDDYPCKVKTK